MAINKFIFTIIIFIIALVVIFLFTLPQYQNVQYLYNMLSQKEATYHNDLASTSQASNLIKDINNENTALSKIDSALPSQFSYAPLLYFFQVQAAQSGLTLKSMTFSQTSPATFAQGIQVASFDVDVFGSYESFKSFILAVESSARLFNVDSIAFDSSGASGLSGAPSGSSQASTPKTSADMYDFKIVVQTNTY